MAATTIEDTRTRVRAMTGSTTDEFSNDAIDAMIYRAVSETDADYVIGDVVANSATESALITRAMITITYARASNASRSYEITGEFSTTKKQQVLQNNILLASALTVQLDEIMESLNVGDSDIQVYRLIRSDRFGRLIPLTLQEAPATPTLTATADGTTIQLSWTQSTEADFGIYRVWKLSTTGVLDTYESSGVNADATCISAQSNRLFPRYEDEGLTAATYYYAVGTYDLSGRKAFSTEVSATVS